MDDAMRHQITRISLKRVRARPLGRNARPLGRSRPSSTGYGRAMDALWRYPGQPLRMIPHVAYAHAGYGDYGDSGVCIPLVDKYMVGDGVPRIVNPDEKQQQRRSS